MYDHTLFPVHTLIRVTAADSDGGGTKYIGQTGVVAEIDEESEQYEVRLAGCGQTLYQFNHTQVEAIDHTDAYTKLRDGTSIRVTCTVMHDEQLAAESKLYLSLRATAGTEEIGRLALFDNDDGTVSESDPGLEVAEGWRRRGVGLAICDFVEFLGYTFVLSGSFSPEGKEFAKVAVAETRTRTAFTLPT